MVPDLYRHGYLTSLTVKKSNHQADPEENSEASAKADLEAVPEASPEASQKQIQKQIQVQISEQFLGQIQRPGLVSASIPGLLPTVISP